VVSGDDPIEHQRDGYVVSSDPARLDAAAIHSFLRSAYWSPGVPLEVVERSIAHSLPFGLYDAAGAQVGFARAVTDRAAFAYLADIYVLPAHRGRGLGVWLVECVLAHPALHGLRRIMLATIDAHSLYERFGFRQVAHPERDLELRTDPRTLYNQFERR
jgi:GNAT superfamily N-acetyltransferase